jgi:hypothetical protein
MQRDSGAPRFSSYEAAVPDKWAFVPAIIETRRRGDETPKQRRLRST